MEHNPCTFAVFGDSYITHLEKFTNRNMDLTNCHFFGVSGMSTRRKCEEAFENLISARARFVFIILGGNDIEDGCSTTDIFDRIMYRVNVLKNSGVESVFVSSIVERGSFLARTGMTRVRFNQVRKAINKKLKKTLKDEYIDLQKRLKYPRHYSRDLIHPGWKEGGMKVLKSVIHRTLTKAYYAKY